MKLNQLYRYIVTPTCIRCDTYLIDSIWFCRYCREQLPNNENSCPICAIKQSQPQICGHCRNETPFFDNTIAAFDFKPPIRQLIHQFKFENQVYLAHALADELYLKLKNSKVNKPELLVPIPLHPKRLRQRGFNQSTLIAKRLASRLDIPFSINELTRIKHTPPQHSLSALKRELAVKNAFKATNLNNVKHIGLIDDVVSTTHTVNQASKALKKANFKEVSVWVLARNQSEY